jgi:hypothetical protein
MRNLEDAIKHSEENAMDDQRLEYSLGKNADDTREDNWRTLIRQGAYKLKEEIEVEFLAKRLMYSQGQNACLLATPLYVAIVD